MRARPHVVRVSAFTLSCPLAALNLSLDHTATPARTSAPRSTRRPSSPPPAPAPPLSSPPSLPPTPPPRRISPPQLTRPFSPPRPTSPRPARLDVLPQAVACHSLTRPRTAHLNPMAKRAWTRTSSGSSLPTSSLRRASSPRSTATSRRKQKKAEAELSRAPCSLQGSSSSISRRQRCPGTAKSPSPLAILSPRLLLPVFHSHLSSASSHSSSARPFVFSGESPERAVHRAHVVLPSSLRPTKLFRAIFLSLLPSAPLLALVADALPAYLNRSTSPAFPLTLILSRRAH